MLVHLVESWVLSAAALWIVAQILPGLRLRDFGAAMLAVVIIAVVNATVGPVVKFFAFPFTLITLGLFLLVINAALLKLSSLFTPGFEVHGFLSALLGSVLITIFNSALRHLVFR
ncbi:MAG TPA: phage holin family protein [Bryobacteraceae bacterium]|nr:phage holin family protein [Bryobacteraceae bacterium]